MARLSAHFERWEFDCHDGTLAHPDPKLIACLEKLRAIIKRPIRIVSGYRTEAYNRSIGGAPHSLHIVNKAADLVPGTATSDQARAAGFTGIGVCHGYAVHVDVRPGQLVIFPDC